MAPRIRLRRTGAHKKPSYRVVVADSTAPRDGKFIENLGFYNPLTDPATIVIKEDRALYWLGVGARPTETTASLLKKAGIMDRFQAGKSGGTTSTATAEATLEETGPATPAPTATGEASESVTPA